MSRAAPACCWGPPFFSTSFTGQLPLMLAARALDFVMQMLRHTLPLVSGRKPGSGPVSEGLNQFPRAFCVMNVTSPGRQEVVSPNGMPVSVPGIVPLASLSPSMSASDVMGDDLPPVGGGEGRGGGGAGRAGWAMQGREGCRGEGGRQGMRGWGGGGPPGSRPACHRLESSCWGFDDWG